MKRLILLFAAVAIGFFTLSAVHAGPGYDRRMQSSDDAFLEGESLARICFVKKRDDGKDYVFIRIPPAMYRFAKTRAKMKRGKGVVRVLLRPRHHVALQKVTGNGHKKIMLRLAAKRFKNVKGLKGHYVIRPLAQFTGKGSPSED